MTQNNLPQYQKAIVLSYKIKLKTGLHIGGSKGGLKIGGIDASVVKHPITNEPYIPGSSLKGRMRALIEMSRGEYTIIEKENKKNGKSEKKIEYHPVQDPNNEIAKAFGCARDDVKIASRIIFEDFVLTEEWRKKFNELKSDFFEDKAENSVPRFLSGNANPRHIERVPAGVEFKGKIVLTPVEGDYYPITKDELDNILKEGIELVKKFGLGGGVSRGNGRVEIDLEDKE